MSGKTQFRIGELAAELGLNPRTIRFYEQIGLLPEPQRAASGYRVYSATDLERLRFIAKAKAIGLSLDEIAEILSLRRDGKQPCQCVLGLVDRKIEAVDRQLRVLADFREDLLALREEAARTVPDEGKVCSIIEHHTPAHPSDPGLMMLAPVPQVRSRR
jgi:DNA-binding transcriptional MerR regulator